MMHENGGGAAPDSLPAGTITLLFSDIEGSTVLLQQLGPQWAEALTAQRSILRECFAAQGGREMGTEGDSFFVVFPTAGAAVSAAAQTQRRLASFDWPAGERVRVRMGIHTGSPAVHDGGYVGIDVHRAARIASAAHGGQVVVSQATAHLLDGCLPETAGLRDLGSHQLKDLALAERLFQLTIDGLDNEFAPLKTLGAASSLPRPATPLVGRDGELAELTALLGSPEVRLVTLTGPGGSGKTRLAIALAQGLVESFPDGVFLVPLAAVTTEDVLWSSIGETLDVPPHSRTPPSLFDFVAYRATLLVLDNLEQIEAADTVVTELVDHAAQVVVIATSRKPLAVEAEHVHPVPPLELPDQPTLANAESSGAVQLFVQHARKVQPAFRLTSENAADVVEVCRRLDGLPLAIELAAARARLLSPKALLPRLDLALDLTATGRQRPARQHTLRETVAWSYDLLTADQQALFRRLGVFAGGADLDAVTAVSATPAGGDPLDAVAELVDLSLVTISEGVAGEPRVGLLETIALFARERLTAEVELDSTRYRHARHYAALAETLVVQQTGRQLTARERLEAELDNFRAALTWTLQPDGPKPNRDKTTLGLRLAAALWWFWFRHGYWVEARGWLERAVQVGSDDYGKAMASALYGLQLVLPADQQQRLPDLLARSLAISENVGDSSGISRVWNSLAGLRLAAGEPAAARELYERSIALNRKSGDDSELFWASFLLANLEQRHGDPRHARQLCQRALDAAHRSGDEEGALAAASDIAWALALEGRGEDALRQLHGLTEEVLRRRASWLTIGLIWAYSAVFAVLGDATRAAALQGTHEIALRGDDATREMDPSDRELIERCYVKARTRISPDAWEQARHQGRNNSLELAVADAHQAAEALLNTASKPLSPSDSNNQQTTP